MFYFTAADYRLCRGGISPKIAMLGIQLGGIYPGLFTHTCATVTKQYNLVAVAGQCYPATGKVTVGLALQRHASQT